MKGPELWEKAKKIIPGGNQLLSKRSERFLPGLWPAYYSKAKGCEVWDVEGNHYYDFASMGIGTCVLGYADDDINNTVINAIKNGSMNTLNSYEGIDLAEKLIKLHPYAGMVRFARTGGEACAIAIRIARAATNKTKVAFCGYHGWHDWYLSANIASSSNLDGLLLPGLEPKGVPRELRETAIPFEYNDLKKLEEIVENYNNEIGVIIMEPRRDTPPKPGFLKAVRKIANEINAVLIFDEVTSGFRMNLGGIHMYLNVMPDIAVFGKAMGNGFPITAIVGKEDVMDAAQDTFISSTFWTERIGFVASLATLEKMEANNVQKELIRLGDLIISGWEKISRKNNVPIQISGIPPLPHISFEADEPFAVQTLYAQDMLEKGYLLGPSIYTTSAYTDSIIDKFLINSDIAFKKIREALDSGDIRKYLKGEILSQGFKRLT
ncbi:MAG: aminotransferase class III-fold pyridoxal phosphate-dependent enzyme [Promethearchaeota archaeon]